MNKPHPIVLVTGANSGVGFGICHRLLIQLSRPHPPDATAYPRTPTSRTGGDTLVKGELEGNWDSPFVPCDALTLIMACRNVGKAEVARTKLYSLLDKHIKCIKGKGDIEYAERFRRNLRIEIHTLDLSIINSIFTFAREVCSKYPYISHLILNAAVAGFTAVDWILCAKQLSREFVVGLTSPLFKLSPIGEISDDGLGWAWQCNVFGHYVLFRALDSILQRSPRLDSPRARVIWMSSVEAIPAFYDPADWQLVQTNHSYEAGKYQIDLIAAELDRLACIGVETPHLSTSDTAGTHVNGNGMHVISNGIVDRSVVGNTKSRLARHIVVQPGIVATKIASKVLNSALETLMVIAFYIARWLGSTNHPISPYKSAIVAVHIALISLAVLPLPSNDEDHEKQDAPLKFGSETNRWGTERVGVASVRAWDEFGEESKNLVGRCERLYLAFAAKLDGLEAQDAGRTQ